jgi:hypothetical protein
MVAGRVVRVVALVGRCSQLTEPIGGKDKNNPVRADAGLEIEGKPLEPDKVSTRVSKSNQRFNLAPSPILSNNFPTRPRFRPGRHVLLILPTPTPAAELDASPISEPGLNPGLKAWKPTHTGASISRKALSWFFWFWFRFMADDLRIGN